ncbi:MAG: hypothetical protein IIB57_08020 [Planctomycetes bacterium]|nr:hypothetical protein [Planctomycetota bacterium]
MLSIEHLIEHMGDRVARMFRRDAQHLDESLKKLSFEQVDSVCGTLERAFFDGRISMGKYRFLERFFDNWHTHTLPTKLAGIAFVRTLSEPDCWPATEPMWCDDDASVDSHWRGVDSRPGAAPPTEMR